MIYCSRREREREKCDKPYYTTTTTTAVAGRIKNCLTSTEREEKKNNDFSEKREKKFAGMTWRVSFLLLYMCFSFSFALICELLTLTMAMLVI